MYEHHIFFMLLITYLYNPDHWISWVIIIPINLYIAGMIQEKLLSKFVNQIIENYEKGS